MEVENKQFKEQCEDYSKIALGESERWFQIAEDEMKFARSDNDLDLPKIRPATIRLHKSQANASFRQAYLYRNLAQLSLYIVELMKGAD